MKHAVRIGADFRAQRRAAADPVRSRGVHGARRARRTQAVAMARLARRSRRVAAIVVAVLLLALFAAALMVWAGRPPTPIDAGLSFSA